MKTFVQLVVTISLAASCATIPRSPSATTLDSVTVRVVADGIVHRHIRRAVGPWSIHIVAIDLSRQDLEIVSARALDSLMGRETTSALARRLSTSNGEVIAAINADFFNMKTGEGDLNQVIDGEIVKGVKKPSRAQFGLSYSRTPYIDHFSFEGTAATSNTRIRLDAVNTAADSAIVLRNHFSKHHEVRSRERIVELSLIRAIAETLVTVAAGSMPAGSIITIGDSVYLLQAANRNDLNSISAGDTVVLVLGFIPRTERLKTLVGGLPRIVRDGVSVAGDSMTGMRRGFTETRHPRTGVGFSEDGRSVFFVTVDGRQQSSVGMSLKEFADLMIEAGCHNALNLDGGGSTTMVIEGRIVNSPSDGTGERPIANVLMVVKRK